MREDLGYHGCFRDIPPSPFSLGGALVLIIVGGIWLANRISNRLHEPQTVWAIELTPGLQRDEGGIKSFAIPANLDAVRLQLDCPKVNTNPMKPLSWMSMPLSDDPQKPQAQSANGHQIVLLDVEAAS